jgi:hypothetical protein
MGERGESEGLRSVCSPAIRASQLSKVGPDRFWGH